MTWETRTQLQHPGSAQRPTIDCANDGITGATSDSRLDRNSRRDRGTFATPTPDDLSAAQLLLLEDLCSARNGLPSKSLQTARRVRGRQAKSAAALARRNLVSIALQGGQHVMWLTPSGRMVIDQHQMYG